MIEKSVVVENPPKYLVSCQLPEGDKAPYEVMESHIAALRRAIALARFTESAIIVERLLADGTSKEVFRFLRRG